MDLENILRQINSDRRNLIHGWPPPLVLLDDTISGTQMPSGAIHPIISFAELFQSGRGALAPQGACH
jgi:hypothetical protein